MPRRQRCSSVSVLASLFALTLCAAPASAAPASARVTAAISIEAYTHGNGDGSLNFGEIAPNLGGTVTIDPSQRNRNRLSYSGVTMVRDNGISDAWFRVYGIEGALYRVFLPASTVVTSPADLTMLVDAFRCCPDSMSQGNSRVFSTLGRIRAQGSGGGPAGRDELYIGATLHVGADQASGLYTGTFDVSVGYE
jgi:hypothetical protein